MFELLVPSGDVLDAIAHGENVQSLRTIARDSGFRQLRHDGFAKAAMGLTTIDEVVRVSAL